jgi:hypothetical protein
MSNAGRKATRLWDGAVEYQESAPNPTVEAIKPAIGERLAAFEQHKKGLLDTLSDIHKHGPQSAPFDYDITGQYLTSLAQVYLGSRKVREKATAPAVRVKRLRDFAKALGRARHLANKVMEDDVKGAVFSAWCEEAVKYDVTPEEPHTLIRFEDEFDKAVAGISHLEAAAERAAVDVVARPGRPKGTAILPPDFIETLAIIYQDSTLSKAGAGDGPFARFVVQFLIALSSSIEVESVIGCVKDALASARFREAKPPTRQL